MRRIILALLLLCMNLFTYATNIWEGSKTINWNNNSTQSISADCFADVQVTDRIIVTFTAETEGVQWPQVALYNSSWKSLAGSSNVQLTADMTQATFYVTSDMLAELKSGGLIVSGIGFTITGVDVEAGVRNADYNNAIWIGETDAQTAWAGVTIPASSFANAKEGYYLRLNFTNIQNGSMFTLLNSSWKEIEGYGYENPSGSYFQYTIDATLLSVIQSEGMIINGTGYILTHVDIIDPSTLSKLTATVPITNNWVFENTYPEIALNVKNPTSESIKAKVKVAINTDTQASLTSISKTVTLAAGNSQKISLNFIIEQPGFYNVIPTVNGEAATTEVTIGDKKATSFYIGINPRKISSKPDYQDDFLDFWKNTKEELAKVDPEYTLTEIPEKSTSKRKVYLLEYKSLPDSDGTVGIARAYYAEPTDGDIHPALIHYQGYDGGTDTPWCMGGDDNPDYAELIVSTRGQVINNREPYTNTYGDWFVYGFGNEKNYYYRGAFMDAIRAVDFIASRETVDTRRIFAEGASQGGALTLAAAALSDTPLTAIAPSIPFLGDFPDYFDMASWPAYPAHQAQEKLGLSNTDMFRFLSYFDTKNLATLITCPVTENISLQDNVCPPHTGIAPFNNLPSTTEKHISYNATLQHATSTLWSYTYMKFFKGIGDSIVGIEDVNATTTTNDDIYSIQGVKYDKDAVLPHGVYVIGGRKVIR